MQIDNEKIKIRRSFNKSVETYDEYCTPQWCASEKLISLIPAQYHAQNIIDLGCGTGLITKRLADHTRYKRFYAIDIAYALLQKARINLKNYPIHIQEADFDHFEFDCKFDLVFTNMALQWSLDLNKTLQSIYHQLNPQGLLLCSFPLNGTFQELSACGINKLFELDVFRKYLLQHNFTVTHCKSSQHIYQFTSQLQAIQSIKATGANCLLSLNSHTLRGKSFLQKLIQTKPFTLTYQIGYFAARK